MIIVIQWYDDNEMKNPILQIKINNKEDLDLFDFTSSMAALNDEYYRFIRRENKKKNRSEYRLSIKKVSQGSIILELGEIAPAVLPSISPLLIEYSTFLVQTLSYLSGRKDSLLPSFPFLKEDFLNFKKLVEPIVNVQENSIGFIGLNFGKVTLNSTYNNTDANAAQNKCDKEIKKLEKSGQSLLKENVELKLYQARNSNLSKSTQGNLGIVSEISDKPKVLAFANDRLRYNITKAESNPFNFIYNVDIEVKLKEGSIFLESDKDIKEYEILNFHGVIGQEDLF